MKRIITLTLLTFLFGSLAIAQEQQSLSTQADLLFNRYKFYNAALVYQKLVDKKKPEVKFLERLAACYRMMNNYKEAEKWYAKAVADPKAAPISHLYYAEVLQRNQEFEKAKKEYLVYGEKSSRTEEMALKIASCDSAVVWTKQPNNYTVKNEASLNTAYADWGLNYYGKNGVVFTSERPVAELLHKNEIYQWTGNPWLKLFTATPDHTAIEELIVRAKEYSAFKTDYHVGPMVLNGTEDTAYVTVSTRMPAVNIPLDAPRRRYDDRLYTRRLELLILIKSEGKWSSYQHFPYNDVKAFSVGHAALSKNGQVLYFTSDRPGGFGKTDIWYSEKQENGSWGNPVNCGPEINTDQEEAFATTGPDGTLYFSSKGRVGMGGFDIYVTSGEKSKWDKVSNLKYPVNTTSDDFYLVTKNGDTGYFSSDREGGKGNDDIYSFTYQKPVVVVLPAPPPSKPPVAVTKPVPFEVGKTYALRKIHYDYNQSVIRPDAAKELDELVLTLKEYPSLVIELSSHTDSRGNDGYNLLLSQRRAEAAVKYLVEHGIDKDRLVAKGYGETHLLNKCANGVKCTEAQHQMNRRTEFKVLK